jgi:transposase-like protein
MTMTTNEQDIRREAIRRRLQGERRCDICRDLNRATSWFDKWWAEFRRNPHTDFADRSRAPLHSPQQMPLPSWKPCLLSGRCSNRPQRPRHAMV